MKRLLIDVSHVLKEAAYAAKGSMSRTVIFEDKPVLIPHHEETFEIFLANLKLVLKALKLQPINCVIVKDGVNCKQFRRRFLEGYCVRPNGAPEWAEEFKLALAKVERVMLDYGAISVGKAGVEADDLIAYLAKGLKESVIWSGDKDLLAAGDVFYKGELNPDKFGGIPREDIHVYRALVGDTSDKIPGCRNFGPAAFRDMITKYGYESVDEIRTMLEDMSLHQLADEAKNFKPFQKILDNVDEVYNSYECVKFHHPGVIDQEDWGMVYPTGDGNYFQGIDYGQELVTNSDITPESLSAIKKLIAESPYINFDIETYQGEESKAWSKSIRSKSDKYDPVDTLGSILAGFSITVGKNLEKSLYFAVDHKDTDNLTRENVLAVLRLLDCKKVCTVHNSAFELVVIKNLFPELGGIGNFFNSYVYDTMIMVGYVDEYDFKGLKHWSKRLMDYDQVEYKDVVGDGTMNDVTGEQAFEYGCDDTICTGQILSFCELVMSYEECFNSYVEVDFIPQYMFAQATLDGVDVDLEELKRITKDNDDTYNMYLGKVKQFLMKPVTTRRLATFKEVHGDMTPVEKFKLMAEFTQKQGSADAIYVESEEYWNGAEFVPIKDFTKPELLRAVKIATGKDIKYSVRAAQKVIEEIAKYDTEIAQHLADGNLTDLNSYLKPLFVPDPIINVKSPPQMSKLMYEFLGLPVRIRGKVSDIMRSKGQSQGNPSANDNALKHAIAKDCEGKPEVEQLIRNLIKVISCRTEDGLFFKPYVNFPHWNTGKVHGRQGQAMAKSGRQTPAKPNLSQVSKVSPVRRYYTVPEDYVWVSFDIEGQELIHTACHSQDPNLLDCYRGEPRKDVHSRTGTPIWNMFEDNKLTYEEFNSARKDEMNPLHDAVKKYRTNAKPVNFKKIYLGTAMTLALDLIIPEEDAEKMMLAWEQQYPEVKSWQDSEQERIAKVGFNTEPMGRRRRVWLDGSWKDKKQIRGAFNHKIQGGAASQVKLIMKAIYLALLKTKLRFKFLFPVHDEINFAVHKDDVVEFCKIVHPIVTMPYSDFEIDFRSSIEIGPNFGRLMEVGTEIDESMILKAVRASILYNSELKNMTECTACGKKDCFDMMKNYVFGDGSLDDCIQY